MFFKMHASNAHILYYTLKHILTHLLHFYIEKMTTEKLKINWTPLLEVEKHRVIHRVIHRAHRCLPNIGAIGVW